MLLMVIERFKNGDIAPVGERFRREGRSLPEGVEYQASWIEPSGACCYQIMQAPSVEALAPWTAHWQDLVEFEIVPVLTSAEFWEKVVSKKNP